MTTTSADQAGWRNTTIIRDNVFESVRALKQQPGKSILTDGSSQLVHALLEHDLVDELHVLLYPLTLAAASVCCPLAFTRNSRCCRQLRTRLASWDCTTHGSGKNLERKERQDDRRSGHPRAH
jgi:dihydrofolate reductase